nr:AHH domain-containing protein [Flavobacterium covae]
MEYDALGRRIKKICNEKTNRYLWDGNVLLHEWTYLKGQEAETSVNDLGEVYLSQKETVEDLVTWIYQENSFVPSAKIQGEEQFSIISDYIGRPLQCYNEKGSLVWSTDYDIYGGLRNFSSPINLTPDFIPFRQLGQYEDPELEGLYYNRFRYYDCSIGNYISQDPIGLHGNNPTFYGYVTDINTLFDPFGLMPMPSNGWSYNNMPKIDGYQNHHVIPRSMADHPAIKAAGFDVDKPSNLIYLPKEQGTHPTRSQHKGWNKQHKAYNADMFGKLKDIHDIGKAEGWSKKQYSEAIEDLRSQTRKGLREGRIKCH